MMAAAEARAAWQRTANRYFVQEDAKRAPKLACCPSSSSSKSQVDMGPGGDAANGPEHIPSGFVPRNWNTSNSNLSPDTKWWLQLQPNFGHQKDFTPEQLNVLELELESLRNEEHKIMSNLGDDPPTIEDISHMCSKTKTEPTEPSFDLQSRISATCFKNDSETIVRELTTANCDSKQKTVPHKNISELWYKDEKLIDIDPVSDSISEHPEKLFDLDSPWMGGVKTEPWWRTADKDDLASLVAQKSLEHVENCDLPPPQPKNVRTGRFTCIEKFAQDRVFSSSDKKEPSDLCSSANHSLSYLTCVTATEKQQGPDEKGASYVFDKLLSTNNQSTLMTQSTEPSEPSKAQLMEALRHSQTRAREAENAAQKAYDEKEHIIKLFFRQASHLFAYKQWLQLLQLETICLQHKNKDQAISTLFPMFLPWMPYKPRQWKKNKHNTKKIKHGHPRYYSISRYAVAFAVGLGLAGAGLLLGWTMGWLFPMF